MSRRHEGMILNSLVCAALACALATGCGDSTSNADAAPDNAAPLDFLLPVDTAVPVDTAIAVDAGADATVAPDATAPVDAAIVDLVRGADLVVVCTADGGCYLCPPSSDPQFLNQCTAATCSHFDNHSRLPLLTGDGGLPPLP